ncbi:DNA topoisomerase IV, B subunit [Candidatus Endolissoclinum faulkneri L5]|uniref:DNA topoisomerase 4 subunit B n=1 Tax=Candidatus Endolissoclinum faulkneri L5 TaxID=1401328 RepID=V9TWH5_9PROT|nr:DNA topoisomerase IV subunit B [Candidatus Endolissoclinum faulkneri]AHC73665.1 DNA topoisomerase IV, B subunit [Candidatus Endolissoclinum faulkneri L5]
MSDFFANNAPFNISNYSAKDIEVLDGLEPVRRRPGMYVGGTDERAMHHLVAEVLDNSMDEAIAGFASRIGIELSADQTVTIYDNGRGIPIDQHPRFSNKSALEVILTTLHSGSKFSEKVYATAGGLHGVGISVVNALSDRLEVEVFREQQLYRQRFSRGIPTGVLESLGNRLGCQGTTVRFHPDPEIFGAKLKFRPSTLFRMARSKAYLVNGVEIYWKCDSDLLNDDNSTPQEVNLHYPGGLSDFLAGAIQGRRTIATRPFIGDVKFAGDRGRVEWAITWPNDQDNGLLLAYCNAIPTPQGGTHESGLRNALARGIRAYGELVNNKKAAQITSEDTMAGACVVLSIFIADPAFHGQTKDKLATASATKLVDQAIKDHFDHWLSGDPDTANQLLNLLIERAENRLRRRQQKEISRKTAARRLRLPGKLADCSRSEKEGTEIFLVEGDSAGGSAKQARNRETQAILPLRGKILNVASATAEKLRANQELSDLLLALGCGSGSSYQQDALRYEKVIIMTDADVDGAHIASLLITFFYRELYRLIADGNLYLAMPPLYKLVHNGKTFYARDDAHREKLVHSYFSDKDKIEISRFKGLGEMQPAQLKETTMDPRSRQLIRIRIPPNSDSELIIEPELNSENVRTRHMVETLMGKKAYKRMDFIQSNAQFVLNLDI